MSAVVHYDKDGNADFFTTDNETMLIIDERVPNDRVYRISATKLNTELLSIIASSPIGHAEDERHAAIAHRINAHLDGKPRLAVVSRDDDRKEP